MNAPLTRLALLALTFTLTACGSAVGPPPDAPSSPPASSASPGSATSPGSTTSLGSATPPGSPVPSNDPSSAAATSSASPSAAPDPDELVLRIDMGGGLAGPDQNALSIPQVSVYADGRVISEGAQIDIYPGPALPSLHLARLSPAGLGRVLEAAAQTGLTAGDRHLPMRGIADAHTTTFTVIREGETHVVTAEALGLEAGHEDQIDATELQARRALVDFQSALSYLAPWLGTDVLAEGLPFEFDELRIFPRPGLPPDEPDLAQPDLEWPLAEPLMSFGEPFPMGEDARCGTVSGEDLQALLPLVMSANQLTRWESGGEFYELLLRPLLPDESGCPET